jgi:ATP-dependent phosphofructokinase / diphosphate-dependent phosphofructokinase
VKTLKVGILSGGGDAPGINAVIRAVVKKGIQNYGYEMTGIIDGWAGLLKEEYMPLGLKEVSDILPQGGSILGSSRTNPFKKEKGPEETVRNVKRAGFDAIIAIGGDDTLGVAHQLKEFGLKIVAVPKTIDNDLPETDYTFGFMTAVGIATEALDRLHTTAETHHRILVLEVMGRYTGWIALEAGLAGGADIILIPEKPFDVEEVCEYIKKRQKRGENFSVIVVAEGAKPKSGTEVLQGEGVDEFGNVRLGGVGHYLSKEIEKRTKIETRAVVLGHIQRGGTPTAFDRILCTRLGLAAIDLVHEGKFDHMVALKGNKIVPIPLGNVIGKRKTVDLELYDQASVFFG